MAAVDWQTGKTTSESSKYMLENEVNCDVNFKVGENEDIVKAHKLILSMRSAVFDRMFNGGFSEANTDPVIPDVRAAAFKMMLRYCYYECLDIEDDIALSVLYASTKYMLPLLEEAARKKSIETLSGSNIWETYRYAIDVVDTKLLDGCRRFFQGDITPIKEALQAEAFLNIPHKVLLEFLHINDEGDKVVNLDQNSSLSQNPGNASVSNIDSSAADSVMANLSPPIYTNYIGISISEIELFKACNAWADTECLRQEINPTGANKRTVLGECLSSIRFPTMLQRDLCNAVFPTGILTPAEIVNLGQYIHRDPGSECQVDFPSQRRQFVAAPSGPISGTSTCTVYIESGVRVMLSRLWMWDQPASYTVTVKDERSQNSWSKVLDTKHGNHLLGSTDYILSYIDIEPPQVLEAGSRYSVTTDLSTQLGERMEKQPGVEYIGIPAKHSPYREVKITTDGGTTRIHTLLLTLV